ncbi:c-type cytochrome [Rhodocytophaga aerolata]|uniref:C-type cytochrome n=1 Tax=Rhodocytophaga aerolata TaxID=455078 RepID=A0ABT8R4C2_9BACT|nr:PVC-type heme-binding CxxCH protein [Rhodocytophaga aerolata]MDO1446531.1 c-type cytochrome [Rhodocytophaga aerolata]
MTTPFFQLMKIRCLPGVPFIFAFLLAGCQPSKKDTSSSALHSLASFELEPGFKIELVASEPLISDPVAVEIDEFGRLYVVEMHGYPLDKSGTGNIKLLSDTDGDGQMDHSTTFADKLTLPTGILRWKKGILVTDPPHVLYLEDSNNDGKADIRKTVLSGFAVSNPQHNVNNPILGIDNWIYLGHESAVTAKVYTEEFGDQGKEITYPGQPNAPTLPQNARGRSVRFRPDSYQLEMTSSNTQFGHSFDAWGNHLLVTNYNHIFQEVFSAPYLNRNPDLLVSTTTQSLSDHGDAAEVFPITQNPQHQLLTDVGVITSACGITAYLGNAFPTVYDSVVFVAEPVSNLIHADRIHSNGSSFTASRLNPQKEFLASTDAWFRPVNMYIGPDGALYIVDYYRQIIEHPEWMADDVVKSGALYNGTDKGRIYRISTTDAKAASWTKGLALGKATNEQLVEYLSHSNIWWRRNAQRLLVDRNSKASVPTLEQLAKKGSSPLGRLHALWTLEGMKQLSPDLIRVALQDSVPGIRENAIKLAELQLASTPVLAQDLLNLQSDSNAKVRYQLLCTLGFIDSPQAALARQKLLFGDIQDEWVQIAALSATSSQQSGLLEAVLKNFDPSNAAHASLVSRLSAMAGASQQPEQIRQLIQKSITPYDKKAATWQASLLEGLAQGLQSKEIQPATWKQEINLVNQAFFRHPSLPVRKAIVSLLKVTGLPEAAIAQTSLQQARKKAEAHGLPAEERAVFIQYLSLGNPQEHSTFLTSCISPAEPLPVQLAALEALSVVPGESVSQYLLQHWPSLTPELRDPAITTFLSDPERVKLLLDAIERGQIQASGVGWRRSVSLMWHTDETLRSRARMLFTKNDKQEQEVIQQYQTALTLKGNPQPGKQVFEQNCMVCHQMAGAGTAFGPDLASIKNRRPASIMQDILNPNQSIADGYDLWMVELTNGESLQGIISSETPTAITLRTTGGQQSTIARQAIKEIQALNMSAMPAGLEKQLNHQQMADLLAYLKQLK